MKYYTTILLEVRPSTAYSSCVAVRIRRGDITVDAPACQSCGPVLATEWSNATRSAVRRARRIHLQVFGRMAP